MMHRSNGRMIGIGGFPFTVAGVLMAMLIASGADRAAAAVPPALADAGEFAENAYDAARDGQWAAAGEKVGALRDAANRLNADLGRANAGVRASLDRLATQLHRLDQAVGSRDKMSAMKLANATTLTVADLSEPFAPKIPVDVTRLDYLGRELEIGVLEKDKDRLQATARTIDRTWSALRADVIKHGGEKEARAFAALVSKVTAARDVDGYAAAVKPILDEVDNLERVYK